MLHVPKFLFFLFTHFRWFLPAEANVCLKAEAIWNKEEIKTTLTCI